MFKASFQNLIQRLALSGFWLLSVQFGQPQKLILELSRRQPVFPTDPEFAGLRQFTAFMAASGWTLELQLQRLSRVRHALLRSAKNGVSMLIFPTVFNGYEDEDLAIMRAFVKKGGHLVWVTEHDNFFRHAESANKFLKPYGLQVKDTALKKGGTNAVDAGWLNAAWLGKSDKKVRVYLPACVSVSETPDVKLDTFLLWPPAGDYHRFVLAVRAHKKGEKGWVSVLTDFEIFWNMARAEGISYGNNQDFLMAFLTSPNQRSSFLPKTMKFSEIKSPMIFQVSREDSLILRALYGNLFRKKPWSQTRWSTLPSSFGLSTASLASDSPAQKTCRYCLCGPQTRFLQAMAAHATELEKRYPGVNMAPRLRQLYEKFGVSSAPQDSAERVSYLLTGVRINDPEIRLEGIPESVSYVGALRNSASSRADLRPANPVFLRRYGAPTLPDVKALQDSSGLVKPEEVLVSGPLESHYFNGLGLWLANITGPLPGWVRRLRRSSWQNLKNWYSLCPK